MSINLNRRNNEYRIKVGARAVLLLNIKDSTGTTKDLTDTETYYSGLWKVWKPDGTLVINGAITFEDRVNGVIGYALTADDTALANAGVWEGEVELKNDTGVMTEQTGTFDFIIEESY